jgi:hypothetical protein
MSIKAQFGMEGAVRWFNVVDEIRASISTSQLCCTEE